MQAIILAGGKGTRLRPYTTVLPKPMMPVGDYPILEIVLRQLRKSGVTEVIMAVGHMGHLFQALFQDGSRLGLKISYSFEDKPLGTAGPIGLLLNRLEEDFIVMNGDLLTTLKYDNLFAFHKEAKAAATIATYQREVKIDFGIVETDKQGSLQKYIEKPTYHYDVSMGINVFNSQAIRQFVKPGEALDIPELMMKLKNGGLPVKCFKEPCYWLDIGRIDDYQTASDIFETRKSEFLQE